MRTVHSSTLEGTGSDADDDIVDARFAPSVDAAAELAKGQVVPILKRMLAFDTEAAAYDSPVRDDLEHQRYVGGCLEKLGADVELIEPRPEVFAGHRMVRSAQSFAGRPILWARVPGRGEGPSLLFNGHYDTVPAGPATEWQHPALGVVAGDRIYGRGACDMKGGNAAALAAITGLIQAEVPLAGDLFLNLVPFEEVNGMGTIATMLIGKRADAAICAEPTGLRPLVASRGILELELTVDGRAAHGEIPQPHHSEGGAINAIEKALYVLSGLQGLDRQWRQRPSKQHQLLASPTIIPTTIHGGSFWATWPSSVTIEIEVIYLPTDADDIGGGSLVRKEVEALVRNLAEGDDWLADHRPTFDWRNDFRPAEVPSEHPVVELASRLTKSRPGGFDSSADHVYLNDEGGIPAILLGPGHIEQAHTSDEFVAIAELTRCAELYVELAASWCRMT